MIAVDERGEVVDGDGIIAILALDLGVELVAVTQMTNLGFHALMREHGIRVVTTDVGDRYVLEALEREGGVLGGEQSGHVIYLARPRHRRRARRRRSCSARRSRAGRSSEAAARPAAATSQCKENVRVTSKELTQPVREAVERANAELGDDGRVLVRPSGTEPIIRVLVEAEDGESGAGRPVVRSHRLSRASSADSCPQERLRLQSGSAGLFRAFEPIFDR